MEELLKFWRQLPRFLFGFILVISTSVIILGKDLLSHLLDITLPLIDWETIGNLSSGILILIALFTVSSLGLFFLDLALDLMSIIALKLYRIVPIRNILRRLRIEKALAPMPEVIEAQLAKFGPALLEFTLLKSQSMPDYLEKTQELDSYFSRVRTSLDNIRFDLFQPLAYHNSYTQDQKKLEWFEEEIRELSYLLIVEFALLIAMLRVGAAQYVILLIAIPITWLAVLPVMKQRKAWLASFYIAGYLDSFVAGASSVATMEELDIN